MAKSLNSRPPAGVMSGPELRVEYVNRFVLDNERYWHCAVVNIEEQPPINDSTGPRARWTLKGPGTVRKRELHFTTPLEIGDAIDDEALEEGISDEQEIGDEEAALSTNLLARLCVIFKLLTESQLHPEHLEETLKTFNLRSALGLPVKCQVAKRNRAFIDGQMRPCKPYYAPKVETLKLDE